MYNAQGSVRIADEDGNHEGSPTKAKNEPVFFVEWMITNVEVKDLSDYFLKEIEVLALIKKLKQIKQFAQDSAYAKRQTNKSKTEKLDKFLDFEVSHYVDNFYSFEKILSSKIKVRITFKGGDYGIKTRPHMYVLLPFNHPSLNIKNRDGEVDKGVALGSGCFCEWVPTINDINEIIITLAHASEDHRDLLISVLQSQ